MSRKVKMDFILVGRSYRNSKELEEFNSIDFLYHVQNQIKSHFGYRAVYISDEIRVSMNNLKYPEFYAAGWFISDQPIADTQGKGSELVIVSHGDSMKSAKNSMIKTVEYVKWDELAINI